MAKSSKRTGTKIKGANKIGAIKIGAIKIGAIKKGGKWSLKYKKSINCKHPKGFSQRQHCKYGRPKMNKKRGTRKRK